MSVLPNIFVNAINKKLLILVCFVTVVIFPVFSQTKPRLAILPFTGGVGEDGETIAELFSFDRDLNIPAHLV